VNSTRSLTVCFSPQHHDAVIFPKYPEVPPPNLDIIPTFMIGVYKILPISSATCDPKQLIGKPSFLTEIRPDWRG